MDNDVVAIVTLHTSLITHVSVTAQNAAPVETVLTV